MSWWRRHHPAFFVIAQFDDLGGELITHILGLLDDGVAGYDMQSAFGPLTAAGFGVTDQLYFTNAGVLTFTEGGDPVTFTATVAAVPEPASLSLVGMGLGAIAVWRRRQRQNS